MPSQVMGKLPFDGKLNSCEIMSSLYNMIISQQVFADNIKGGAGLAAKYKTEGTLHGDSKLFYSTDCLKSNAWTNYSEAGNLLNVDRPTDPKVQAVTIDTWRQIRITLDNYLSKRAFSDEGAFGSFRSVMLGWIGKTKEVLDNTMVNVFVGTKVTKAEGTNTPVTSKTITLAANPSSAADYQLRGMKIAEEIANIFTALGDYSRDYNGYGFLRNYEPGDFDIIWNAKYINEIRKVDLPTVFHKDGLVDKFEEKVLPARYFGTIKTTAVTAANNVAATYPDHLRSIIEKDYTVNSVTTHCFPGDQIPYGVAVAANEAYEADQKCICKIVHKDAVKFMSGFQVETEFFNPRSLTDSHYLTYGYGLDNLAEFPMIKVAEA